MNRVLKEQVSIWTNKGLPIKLDGPVILSTEEIRKVSERAKKDAESFRKLLTRENSVSVY